MSEIYPIVITANPLQRQLLRCLFGDTRITFVTEGSSHMGSRTNMLILAPGVSVDSVWFRQEVLCRLAPGGSIYRLEEMPCPS